MKGLRGAELEARVGYVLERCAVANVKDKLLGKLSKGYRQRVGMAQVQPVDQFRPGDVAAAVEAAFAGTTVGRIFDRGTAFDLVVKFDPSRQRFDRAVSLAAEGRLMPSLVLDGALAFAFMPLAQVWGFPPGIAECIRLHRSVDDTGLPAPRAVAQRHLTAQGQGG